MITRSGYLCGAIFASAILFSSPGRAEQAATNAPAQQPVTPLVEPTVRTPEQVQADAVASTAREILQLIQNKDYDAALDKLNAAIKLYPKKGGFYALRGSVYSNKGLFPQSEQDFQTALQFDPNNLVIKFNLVEIKFMQKQYDQARPGFAALTGDEDMGDLAKYKVFLCDLFGGHDDVAKKELDDFNKVGSKASYYFANAASCLYHKDVEGGRKWLISASNIYSPQKNEFYASSLRELGYLPLPPPPRK